jgi:hypothetical protein
MFRLIGIVLALAIVGWLVTRQLDSARNATRSAAETAGAVGVKIDPNARPSDVAAQVGKAVEAQVQGSKSRVDDVERSAGE